MNETGNLGTNKGEETPDLGWDVYANHRDKVDQLRVNQLSTFDSAILTLSPGAIALSLLLLSAFSEDKKLMALQELTWSWFMFVSSILLNLGSYQGGGHAAACEIYDLDEKMRGRKTATATVWVRITRWLNALVTITFIVGTVLLLRFAYVNAAQYEAVAAEQNPSAKQIMEGVQPAEESPQVQPPRVSKEDSGDGATATPTGITASPPPAPPMKPASSPTTTEKPQEK